MIRENKKTINGKNELLLIVFTIIFTVFFSTFFQIFCLPVVATESTTNSGPVITFQEEYWDFGEIDSKEIPSHTFMIKNTGNELLIIKQIEAACESCVDISISKKEILPQENVTLKITVNSMNLTGHFSKRIYLKSNDPNRPQAAIMVSGFVINSKKINSNTEPQASNNDFNDQSYNPFKVGVSYFAKGEYEKAIPEFEKSIELGPNHADSYYYLGQCYLQMGIIEYNKKHIFKATSLYRKANKVAEEVIPLYKKIIEDNPNDLTTFLKLGWIYEVKSNIPFIDEYENALKYYLSALNLQSVSRYKNTGIYIYLNTRIGIIHFQLEEYLQAISYLEKSLETSRPPNNPEVYYYLGISYDKISEKEKAEGFLLKVIEIAPQSEFAREAEKKIKKK